MFRKVFSKMQRTSQSTGESGREVKPVGAGMGQDDSRDHPLHFAEILGRIFQYLPFASLKHVRLVNHLWFKSSCPAWSRKSKISFRDMHKVRDFLTKTSSVVRKVLPFTTTNWTFQGESMVKLWMDQGMAERDHMEQFWPQIKSLTLSEWTKTRFRRVEVIPDPRHPTRREVRKVEYLVLTKIGSAYGVTNTLKLCTNLAEIVIHYPLLTTMKGAYIGPKQFPKLETLNRLEIYYEATKWSNTASAVPNQLLTANLQASDATITLPPEKSGGRTLILRLLDHSPNLTSIKVTSGSIMTTKVENWFLGYLFSETVTLPKLEELRCSIPLQEDICTALRNRPWGLKALHLRTLPGPGRVKATALHEMLDSFKGTLQHLEMVFIGTADITAGHFFGENILCNLKTLELWGHVGSHAFLKDLKELKKAVIGVTDVGSYQRLRGDLGYYSRPGLKLQLKTYANYIQRLDEGPQMLF